MAKKNGAQTVDVVAGRKIVLSAGVGKTNVDELKWLTETVLASAKAWKATGWAYIAEGHFETVEQALAWLKEEVHI